MYSYLPIPPLLNGLNIKSMDHIFIGLVKCAAWGCFGVFNHLEEAVLSAVSIQIQTIQDSIWTRVPTTELLGREVSWRSCECHVTIMG